MKENFKNLLALSKKQTYAITGALLLTSGLGTGLYHATLDTVQVTIDGKKEIIQTHARSVESMLKNENISIKDGDIVSLPLSTKINEDMELDILTEKAVTIEIGNAIKKIYTNSISVESALKDAGYELRKEDKIFPEINELIEDGSSIVYEPAFPVTVKDGKKKRTVWTTSTTVNDLLENLEISLGKHDKVSKKKSELISGKSEVSIDRIKKVKDVVKEELDFEVIEKKDYTLAQGEKRIVTKGKPGIVKKEYEVTLVNGKVEKKKLLSKNVVADSKNQVIAIGAKESSNNLPSRSSYTSGGKEFYVEATAYSPYCNGCSGRTAAGYDIRSNPNMKLIAVDPRVIPLGTKVYVEGYGYAIAGDTGGVIKGNKIDLLMPTEARAYQWGRKTVKIRIVN